MKCRKYKCIISQKTCILRREIIELLKFRGKGLSSFGKCEDCTQGDWVIKNYPVPGLDNDVFKLMVPYKKLKKKKIHIKIETKIIKKKLERIENEQIDRTLIRKRKKTI